MPEGPLDSIRLRIRAVTGSAAVTDRCPVRCGVASMVCEALSALICSDSSPLVTPCLPASDFLPDKATFSSSRNSVRSTRYFSWANGASKRAW